MNTLPRHRLGAIAAAFALGVAACGSTAEVAITDAWSRPVPPVSPASAIFFEISNDLDEPVTLTGATSDDCGLIELHETTIDDAGVMQMQRRPGLEIAAGGSAALAPGGLHLMCLDPKVSEDSFEIVVQFDGAGDVTVPVVIEER